MPGIAKDVRKSHPASHQHDPQKSLNFQQCECFRIQKGKKYRKRFAFRVSEGK
jgi:hypothetical protein